MRNSLKLFSLSALLVILYACAPSPEQQALQTAQAFTNTAAAWTITPTITSTTTPSPTLTYTPTPALPVGEGTPLPETLNLQIINPENIVNLQLIRKIALESFHPENIQFSSDGTYILLNPMQSAYSQSILIVNTKDGTIQSYRGDGAVFSPDAKEISIYYQGKGLSVYQFEGGQPTTKIKTLDGIGHVYGSSPRSALMLYSQDGSLFAADSRSGIHIYDTSDWTEIDLVVPRQASKSISPDWSFYALWGNGTLTLRSFPEDSFVFMDEHLNSNITFSQDGRYLAFNDFYGPVYIYDMTIPAGPWKVIGQRDACYTQDSIAFSPDNQLLALGCQQNGLGIIKIWKIPEGTLVKSISTGSYLSGLTFSPDGKLLAIGGSVSVHPDETQVELQLFGVP